MASEARIRELDARHRDLDEEIEQEVRRPGADGLHITELKRQKLRIKEEVEALRSRMAH
ncbi:MAG: YdcH family protein [Hyphomonadaceae bacterium]